MRVFLDANILLSAARTDGAIRRLLEPLREAGHTLCVDAFVIEEARRNLAANATPSLSKWDPLLAAMERLPTFPPDREWLSSLPLPEKDQPVLGAAVRGGCEFLITGDGTHFGPLFGKVVHGVAILAPAAAAENLR